MRKTLCCMTLLLTAASSASPARVPFDALFLLDTRHYTGGLTRADRALAEQIRALMAPRYTATCGRPDPMSGTLVSTDIDGTRTVPPSSKGVDPDFQTLIRALDDPRQEVRDVAAYTIGLLGPGAKAAEPILGKKFSSRERGGWYNSAYGRITCSAVVVPDLVRVVPSDLLPAAEPRQDYNVRVLTMLADLYLDPDVEYPPGILGDPDSAPSIDAVQLCLLLAKILDDSTLSDRKRFEAAVVLGRAEPDAVRAVLPILYRAAASPSRGIRHYVGEALYRLRDPAAVPLLIEDIGGYDDWGGEWDDRLCDFGPTAIAAEDRLIDIAVHSDWPTVVRRAVRTLGCIRSVKALPVLTEALRARDWPLNLVAARAIAAIGTRDPGTLAVLNRLAATHWSLKVRDAASATLEPASGAFSARDMVPAERSRGVASSAMRQGRVEIITVGGLPGPFYHGLTQCASGSRYSIDGRRWFHVAWRRPAWNDAPPGFRPKIPLVQEDGDQKIGTQTFLRVRDGWLMGSSGFEFEGVLAHVGNDGAVQLLRGKIGGPTIFGIVRASATIYAFGLEFLRDDPAGSLFEIAQDGGGDWHATRILALPSPPRRYALAPSGELLLSDGPNEYAIVQGDVVPLKCEKTAPDSYFDKNPEGYWDQK